MEDNIGRLLSGNSACRALNSPLLRQFQVFIMSLTLNSGKLHATVGFPVLLAAGY